MAPAQRWVNVPSAQTQQAWLSRNLFVVVFVSRFIPGTRLPLYTACGFFRAGLAVFTAATFCATLLWTTALFMLSLRVGERFWPILAHGAGLAWPALWPPSFWWGGLLRAPKNTRYDLIHAPSQQDKQPNPLSLFEFWPRWVFYTPVVAYWILLGLRYRDVTLPTAANPRITTGGLCGKRKATCWTWLAHMPPNGLRHTQR